VVLGFDVCNFDFFTSVTVDFDLPQRIYADQCFCKTISRAFASPYFWIPSSQGKNQDFKSDCPNKTKILDFLRVIVAIIHVKSAQGGA
jgi:hypothetical protein